METTREVIPDNPDLTLNDFKEMNQHSFDYELKVFVFEVWARIHSVFVIFSMSQKAHRKAAIGALRIITLLIVGSACMSQVCL